MVMWHIYDKNIVNSLVNLLQLDKDTLFIFKYGVDFLISFDLIKYSLIMPSGSFDISYTDSSVISVVWHEENNINLYITFRECTVTQEHI